MPKVPTITSPSIQTQGLPSARLTAAPTAQTLGAGVGQSVSRAGSQLAGLVAQEQQRANETAIIDAMNQYQQGVQSRLYDAETGVLTQKGKDAIGAGQSFYDWEKDHSGKIEQGLNNDFQRETFRQRVAGARVNQMRQIEPHIAQERTRWQQQALTGQATLAQREMVALAQQIANAPTQQQRDQLEWDLLMQSGLYSGTIDMLVEDLPKEQQDVKRGELISFAHQSVVEAMLDNENPTQANVYLTEYGDEILPTERVALKQKIDAATFIDTVEAKSAELVATGDERTALQEADKIKDEKTRKAVKSRIREQFEQDRRLDALHMQEQYERLSKELERSGVTSEQLSMRGDYQELDEKYRSALQRQIDVREGRLIPEPNSERYYDLVNMAASTDRAQQVEFMQTYLPAESGNVTPGELSQLIAIQVGLRQGDKSDPFIGGVRTNAQVVNDTLTWAEIDVKEQPELAIRFRRRVDELVGARETELGRRLSPTEVQEIADVLMSPVPTSDELPSLPPGLSVAGRVAAWWLTPNRPEAVEMYRMGYVDIPVADRNKIRVFLREAWVENPSTHDVLQTYLRFRSVGGR